METLENMSKYYLLSNPYLRAHLWGAQTECRGPGCCDSTIQWAHVYKETISHEEPTGGLL